MKKTILVLITIITILTGCFNDTKDNTVKIEEVKSDTTSYILYTNESTPLELKILPENADEKLTWKADNETVAEIKENRLMGKKEGRTKITAYSGKTTKIAIDVEVVEKTIVDNMIEKNSFKVMSKVERKNRSGEKVRFFNNYIYSITRDSYASNNHVEILSFDDVKTGIDKSISIAYDAGERIIEDVYQTGNKLYVFEKNGNMAEVDISDITKPKLISKNKIIDDSFVEINRVEERNGMLFVYEESDGYFRKRRVIVYNASKELIKIGSTAIIENSSFCVNDNRIILSYFNGGIVVYSYDNGKVELELEDKSGHVEGIIYSNNKDYFYSIYKNKFSVYKIGKEYKKINEVLLPGKLLSNLIQENYVHMFGKTLSLYLENDSEGKYYYCNVNLENPENPLLENKAERPLFETILCIFENNGEKYTLVNSDLGIIMYKNELDWNSNKYLKILPTNYIEKLKTKNEYVYAASISKEILIYKLESDNTLSFINTINSCGFPYLMDIQENNLFCLDPNNKIVVYDISDPKNTKKIGNLETTNIVSNFKIYNNFLITQERYEIKVYKINGNKTEYLKTIDSLAYGFILEGDNLIVYKDMLIKGYNLKLNFEKNFEYEIDSRVSTKQLLINNHKLYYITESRVIKVIDLYSNQNIITNGTITSESINNKIGKYIVCNNNYYKELEFYKTQNNGIITKMSINSTFNDERITDNEVVNNKAWVVSTENGLYVIGE